MIPRKHSWPWFYVILRFMLRYPVPRHESSTVVLSGSGVILKVIPKKARKSRSSCVLYPAAVPLRRPSGTLVTSGDAQGARRRTRNDCHARRLCQLPDAQLGHVLRPQSHHQHVQALVEGVGAAALRSRAGRDRGRQTGG